MTYINPFVYANHIPHINGFLDGTLPVCLTACQSVPFDQFTPDEAMKWIRKYNSCVAQEKRLSADFIPDYKEYEQEVLKNDGLSIDHFTPNLQIEGSDNLDLDEYDNFLWDLKRSRIGHVEMTKGGRVSVSQALDGRSIEALMTRVEQVDGQRYIEASVDLEKWAGHLIVGDKDIEMAYGFDEFQVAQMSLKIQTTVESLAHYLGREIETNPGYLIYEAAKKMVHELYPSNLVVRSGLPDGGQKFHKLFSVGNVQYVKREEVGMIDGQDDLVARASIDLTSSEIQGFQRQTIAAINLREIPALNSDNQAQKKYFIEVVLNRPRTDRFDSKIKIQGEMREWMTSLWRGDAYKQNLSLEDIFNVESGSTIKNNPKKNVA